MRHGRRPCFTTKLKDPIYVKEFLGHRKLDTTMLYIQLAEALFKDVTDEFTVKVARTTTEITWLLESGFEYVCEKDGLLYFRKRK